MKRLYMRLSEKEFKTLKKTRDDVLGVSSFRATVLALCNTELIRRLSYIVKTEVELRKISVNLNQVIRKIDETEFDIDNILFVREKNNTLIDFFSTVSSRLKMNDPEKPVSRNEIAICLRDEEKEEISSIKRILRFRTFRTMIMCLCMIAEDDFMPSDISVEYSLLREFGTEMNKAAKALNSHDSVDLDSLIKFLVDFYNLLSRTQKTASGDSYVR